jgi:hypothetical protein
MKQGQGCPRPPPLAMRSILEISLVAEEKTIRGSSMGSGGPLRDLPSYIDLYRRAKLPVDKLVTHRLQQGVASRLNRQSLAALERGPASKPYSTLGGYRTFQCLSALASRSKPSTLTDAVSSSRCAPSAAESAIQHAPRTRKKCA